MNVLSNLDFTFDPPTDSVIESRTEVMIDSSTPVHTASNNNIIRLYMNGSGFVDPHSVALYCSFQNNSLANGANVIPPSMSDLVSTIRVLDGSGQVIEEINQAHVLNRLLHNSSSSSDYLDCTGGFSNQQKDVSKRFITANTVVDFRLNATDCLGLFSQEKYIHLPTFKGLQVELRLNSNETVYTVKTGSVDTVTYQLSNVKLVYDQVEVSRGYMEYYSQQIRDSGYVISFPTYTHLQNSVGVGQNQVALNKTASKCKTLVSVLRESGNVNNKNSMETAGDYRISSYQYQLSGKNFPPQPIESKARAFQELLSGNYNHKDNRYANICREDFINNFEFGANDTKNSVTTGYGSFAMWSDVEKASGSPLSGVEIQANSAFLRVTVEAGPVAPVVDTFVCHERVLSITDRIVVVD